MLSKYLNLVLSIQFINPEIIFVLHNQMNVRMTYRQLMPSLGREIFNIRLL